MLIGTTSSLRRMKLFETASFSASRIGGSRARARETGAMSGVSGDAPMVCTRGCSFPGVTDGRCLGAARPLGDPFPRRLHEDGELMVSDEEAADALPAFLDDGGSVLVECSQLLGATKEVVLAGEVSVVEGRLD